MAGKKNILLVDDEPDVTLLVSSLLEFNNHTVTTLNDPTEVVEKLLSGSFDLICTDIMMPNLDGFELIKKIRTEEKLKTLNVIALSAKDFSQEEYKFFLDNNTLLIKKPYEPQDLVAKINDLFKK